MQQQKDKFEEYLDEMVIKLQDCQKQKGVESCFLCKNFIGCELRSEYVKAVYNSMSKGSTGGFEF